jgi:hypothetical protein
MDFSSCRVEKFLPDCVHRPILNKNDRRSKILPYQKLQSAKENPPNNIFLRCKYPKYERYICNTKLNLRLDKKKKNKMHESKRGKNLFWNVRLKKIAIRDKRIISFKDGLRLQPFLNLRANVSLLMEYSFVSKIITWKMCQICLFAPTMLKSWWITADQKAESVWTQKEKQKPGAVIQLYWLGRNLSPGNWIYQLCFVWLCAYMSLYIYILYKEHIDKSCC